MKKRKQQSSRIGRRSVVALLVLAMLISVCVPGLTVGASTVETEPTEAATSPVETNPEETTAPTEAEPEETTAPTEAEPTEPTQAPLSEAAQGYMDSLAAVRAEAEALTAETPDLLIECTAVYYDVIAIADDADAAWNDDLITNDEIEAINTEARGILDILAGLGFADPVDDLAGEPNFSNVTPTIQNRVVVDGTTINDTIEAQGRLYVALPAGTDLAGYSPVYTWYKDGTAVELTTTVLGGETNVAQYGEWVNVAVDQGSGATYTVRLTGIKAADGSVIPLGDNQSAVSAGFTVNYSDEILNGGFETPDVRNNYAANVQYPNPNGYQHDQNQRQFLEGAVAGLEWKTTSACNSIEIISDRNNTEQGNGAYTAGPTALAHGVVNVAAGNQAAELNSQNAGALYQDVLTIPGTTMNWTLEHMGRVMWGGESNINNLKYDEGTDTMYVVIMPTTLAKTAGDNNGEVDTQAEVIKIRDNPNAYQGVQVVQISYTWDWTNNNTQLYRVEGNTRTLLYTVTRNGNNITSITQHANPWVETNGKYPVPEGQFMTRYFFVAGNTASGNNTVGNHIDDISFSIDLPKPNIDKANLKLTKTLKGVDNLTDAELNELKASLQFDVKIGNNDSYTVYGSAQTDATAAVIVWDVNNPQVGTYVLQNYPVTADVDVTITERIRDQEGNYKLTQVVTTDNNAISSDVTGSESYSVAGKLSGGSICDLKFTNTYSRATTSVIITKEVKGNMGDWNKDFTFTVGLANGTFSGSTYTVAGKDAVSITDGATTVDINLKHGESVEITNVPIGATLTVTESGNEGYTVETVVTGATDKDDVHTDSDVIFDVPDGTVTIAYTNTNEVTIDTGISMDSMPYILLISVAAVGAIVLLLNKRRYTGKF